MDTFDVMRLINAALAAIVFGLLVHHGSLRFKHYSGERKALWISFTLYVLAVSYSSAEVYGRSPNGFSSRTILVMIANIVALWTLWRYKDTPFVKDIDDNHR